MEVATGLSHSPGIQKIWGQGKETQKETQFLKTFRRKQSQEVDAGSKQMLKPSAGVQRAQNAGDERVVPKP